MPSVIACPSCQKQLKVPDELIGRPVKCPGCKETFTAQSPSTPPPAQEEVVEKPRKKAAPLPEEEEEPRRPARRRDEDDEEDDRPSRRRGSGTRMQPHRGVLMLILGLVAALGFLISLPTAPLGPFVWWMANNDLKEIDAGRMDPEGRQNTQIGKICGIIATVELIGGAVITCGIIILWCGLLGAIGGAGAH
jgi:predicted Zn finger-like uncharacterized protein